MRPCIAPTWLMGCALAFMATTPFLTLVDAATTGSSSTSNTAPLEPPDGKLLYGPWYDRVHGDTIDAITTRMAYKPFSLIQSDVNITSSFQYPTEFMNQLDDTNTDTIMYLTVYPIDGFDVVTDDALNDFLNCIVTIVKSGRRVLIRYASEMNGSWFVYGQQPTKFLEQWKKVVDLIRNGVPESYKDMYAFIWAPNSGNGYPWLGGISSISNSSSDYDVLDTDGDGVLTLGDDPYSPYYPGDDYVEWVGFSMYHYGAYWPWQQNVIPYTQQVVSLLLGINDYGNYNIYGTFCDRSVTDGGYIASADTSGGKPFIITETAATYHMMNETDLIDPGPGRVAIKKAWWQQYLNETFLDTFSKVKAVSTFEFQKFEETTLRDFTTMGAYQLTWSNETADVNSVLRELQSEITSLNFIIWGNTSSSSTGSSSSGTQFVPQVAASIGTIAVIFILFRGFFQ